MTAPTTPVFRADPTVIVYAVRYALGSRGSHAPILLGDAIRANVKLLPAAARQVLVRDITGWLDGRGVSASRADREPWVAALAALGVSRSAVRAETPPESSVLSPPAATQHRRRADRRAAS